MPPPAFPAAACRCLRPGVTQSGWRSSTAEMAIARSRSCFTWKAGRSITRRSSGSGGNRGLSARGATKKALPQGQLVRPIEANIPEPGLGHPFSGRRLRSNLPSGDVVHDKLGNGRSYKMLTVLDEFTRQALAVLVRTRMGANDVLEALYPLLQGQGSPEYVRSDNGPSSQ